MRKLTFLIIVSIFGAIGLQAQTADTAAVPKYWKLSGAVGINMTQSSYSNWAAGGQNSMAGVGSGNLALSYTKNKWSWDNTLGVSYGLMVQDELGRSKTDDRLELASKLGYRAAKSWYYTFLVQFRTQFDKGYRSYPVSDEDRWDYISRFMAPGYLTISIGMDYNPNPNFSLFLSPISMQATYVQSIRLASLGSYGVEPGKKSLIQYGGFIKAIYQKKMVEDRVLFGTKLELFANWESKPQNVDVNWEVNIDFKVSKWLSTKLYTQMIYDDDIRIPDADGNLKGPKLQLREVLGIGISYIF